MTDNEVIKALECCKNGDCKNCTFDECTTGLLDKGIALSLINRQKAEIAELQHRNFELDIELKAMRGAATCFKAENVKLEQALKTIKDYDARWNNIIGSVKDGEGK